MVILSYATESKGWMVSCELSRIDFQGGMAGSIPWIRSSEARMERFERWMQARERWMAARERWMPGREG
jgi:hypothetical protein